MNKKLFFSKKNSDSIRLSWFVVINEFYQVSGKLLDFAKSKVKRRFRVKISYITVSIYGRCNLQKLIVKPRFAADFATLEKFRRNLKYVK